MNDRTLKPNVSFASANDVVRWILNRPSMTSPLLFVLRLLGCEMKYCLVKMTSTMLSIVLERLEILATALPVAPNSSVVFVRIGGLIAPIELSKAVKMILNLAICMSA